MSWSRKSIDAENERATLISDRAALGIELVWTGNLMICRTHIGCRCAWTNEELSKPEPNGWDTYEPNTYGGD